MWMAECVGVALLVGVVKRPALARSRLTGPIRRLRLLIDSVRPTSVPFTFAMHALLRKEGAGVFSYS